MLLYTWEPCLLFLLGCWPRTSELGVFKNDQVFLWSYVYILYAIVMLYQACMLQWALMHVACPSLSITVGHKIITELFVMSQAAVCVQWYQCGNH